MANRYWDRRKDTSNPSPKGKPAPSFGPEKVPGYPGLPGKSQPRDRSGGDKKVKVYPQSVGI